MMMKTVLVLTVLFSVSTSVLAGQNKVGDKSDGIIQSVVNIAEKSDSGAAAFKNFQLDSVLEKEFNFHEGDAKSWDLEFKQPVSARALCKSLKLKRCYMISGDVHQNSFAIEVWTQDIPDQYGKRIAADFPIFGAWVLTASGDRPDGDLPGVSGGASPAYSLETYDTKIKWLLFSKK